MGLSGDLPSPLIAILFFMPMPKFLWKINLIQDKTVFDFHRSEWLKRPPWEWETMGNLSRFSLNFTAAGFNCGVVYNVCHLLR